MDILTFVKSLGYLGIFATIFAESGILFAALLPGDSLLFATGFMAARGKLDIALIVSGCFLSAIAGNCIGYYIGKKIGVRALEKESHIIKKSHVAKTERFFKEYGPATIVIARFVPIVRTFAPFLAGMVRMPFNTFLFYSVVGAFLWVGSLCLLGFYLGRKIHVNELDQYVNVIAVVIVAILLCPTIFHLTRRYITSKRQSKVAEISEDKQD